ncbi:hypothetical protein [Streptomyces sp. NPDC007088]|uniref:hypothetical protein n=1 Tax=Streptomyces sp. NPDC007088 TaxID=3364773 RepID=UPI0036792B5D
MPDKEFTIAVPAADDGAVRPWRKLLRGLDESKHGALSCLGDWLEAGASFELPIGAVIVLCDPLPGGDKKRVRIWRVKTDGTIKEERDSTLGSTNAFGTSIRGTMRRLLDKHPPRPGTVRQLTSAAPRVNERADTCGVCRQPVAARAGILERNHRGYSEARHQPGQCPPPAPIKNDYAQGCGKCGGWLEKGEGVLYEAAPGLSGGKALLKARHPQECPPPDQRTAPPPRANMREQDCILCGNLVAAGNGLLVRRASGTRRASVCRRRNCGRSDAVSRARSTPGPSAGSPREPCCAAPSTTTLSPSPPTRRASVGYARGRCPRSSPRCASAARSTAATRTATSPLT